MLGRGLFRVALNGRFMRGGSFGRGSEKKRTRLPDGVLDVRNAEGRVRFSAGLAGIGLRGAKKPVARVGSSVSAGDEGAGAAAVGPGCECPALVDGRGEMGLCI